MMDKRRSDEQERAAERIPDDETLPALDEAGGLSREELDPRRSGAAPVRQNDRTRDRELKEEPPQR
jgi:hypothetical protein